MPFSQRMWFEKDVKAPKVIMVHGEEDEDVPIALARDVVGELGGERARVLGVRMGRADHDFDEGLFWGDEGLREVGEAWGMLDCVVEREDFGGGDA